LETAMNARQFRKRLEAEGFEWWEPIRGIRVARRANGSGWEVVEKDVVKGGNLRLLLARDCVPGLHPLQKIGPEPIEAESPWWDYDEPGGRASAHRSAWSFMEAVGFTWLASPRAVTSRVAREQWNLIVTDHVEVTGRVVCQEDGLSLKEWYRLSEVLPEIEPEEVLRLRKSAGRGWSKPIGPLPKCDRADVAAALAERARKFAVEWDP